MTQSFLRDCNVLTGFLFSFYFFYVAARLYLLADIAAAVAVGAAAGAAAGASQVAASVS